ncbi:PEP-CTERM protein-sorting domain-containing protein, partial [Nitrosomonas oligotropha]
GEGRPTPKVAIIAPVVLVLAVAAFFFLRKRKPANQNPA